MGSAADLGTDKRSEVVVKEGSGSGGAVVGAGGCGRGGAGGSGAVADLEDASSALAVAELGVVDVLNITGVPAMPVQEAMDSKVNPLHVGLEEVIHPLYLSIFFLFDYLLSGVVICVRIW